MKAKDKKPMKKMNEKKPMKKCAKASDIVDAKQSKHTNFNSTLGGLRK